MLRSLKPQAIARAILCGMRTEFASCHVLAQRARCAAAIFLRAAWLIVRTGVDATRLVFAHRAFSASEIFRRAAAESESPAKEGGVGFATVASVTRCPPECSVRRSLCRRRKGLMPP